MDSDQEQSPGPTLAAPQPAPIRRRPGRALWVVASAIIVVVLALGILGYFVTRPHSAPTTQHAASKQPQAVTPNVNTDTGLATYVSKGKDLNLSFSYPASWNAVPASGDNSADQPITVTSPVMTIPSAAGQSVNGKLVLLIRPGGSDITELDGNSASVALDSIQIAYTKPTPNQNLYPFITFVHLTAGNNASAVFEEVVITGINKFTKGQALLAGSLGQVDPIISVTFYQCAASGCTGSGATPLSITSGTWNNSTAGQQALAIFQSLQIN